MQHTVDVIILTFKPTKQVFKLIEALENQTHPISKIVIMNTEEKYFERTFYGTGFLDKYHNIEIHHISEKEFDHGKTRNRATAYSKADIFVCMTQDAIPADKNLIQELVEALTKENGIAAAYARQLPLQDSTQIERFTRAFNYPEESVVKSKADIERLGIKTYFCSNVCAAYHRNIFDMLGGFVKRAIFNEDMIYAGMAVQAGYKISYAAKAQVYHAHHYTCKQQFSRNFDLGVSQAQHPEIFRGISSKSEGVQLVRRTIQYLREQKKSSQIPYLILSSGCKYLGYQFGMHYKTLPYGMIVWCSSNKEFWKHEETHSIR